MQTEYVYNGAIVELPEILQFEKAKKILIFTGKKSFLKFQETFQMYIKEYECIYYNDFSNNPKENEVLKARERLSNDFDIIIAFGGGSVIDFAKCFKFSSDNNIRIKSFFEDKIIPRKKMKLIAIPTTAGTGAEATQFAVVYINGIKYSLDDISILPDYKIVDANFVREMPKYQKATCAIDAFCQAIESYWAVNSNEKSKYYAKNAIILCHKFMKKYVNSNDIFYAEKMAEASYLAGCAINISRTTAAHAISYPFTSVFGIPHGHAVSLSIGNLAEYNLKNITENNINDKRGITYIKKTMEELQKYLETNSFKNYFDKLLANIELETNFQKLGINNFDTIINAVDLLRLSNNPIKISKKFFDELFLNK